MRQDPGRPLARTGSVDRRGDDGVTLVELVVGMALAGLLLITVAGVYTSGLRTASTVMAKTSTTADAAFATDVISRRLRVAVTPNATDAALVVAQADKLSFYASVATSPSATVDPVPTLVAYAYDASSGCLTETLTPGSGAAAPYTWTTGARTTCLVRGSVSGGGSSIFTYYAGATGSTTTATASAVRSVGVSLAVTQTSGAGTATTRDSTRVVLENLGL
ncbi:MULTISPECIES: PilW family protein [Actinomycetes]|uniref:Prepilin-type N-terminal cleavage/methylation domain-containing protein n=1 Tax=Pseudokineococcus lusitanus TaxID=763993 RepID=A0A3N1G9D8_9ACTN|nr:hypothetical protein [Pseudokineococcus lusitanus]ROP26831.1 hypothetical protein EDC03_3068 [Pseudokineococcus lusitanus]